MKSLILVLLVSLNTLSARADEIRSNRENAQVNVARVVQLVSLENQSNLKVNIVVQDMGGSTDMSPTQKVFLTLYAKGEMFSTDAAFELKSVFSLKAVKRVSAGLYEISVQQVSDSGIDNATYAIDARRAIADLKKVDCGSDFDCSASEKFESAITMIRK